jgi:hypothetical protein
VTMGCSSGGLNAGSDKGRNGKEGELGSLLLARVKGHLNRFSCQGHGSVQMRFNTGRKTSGDKSLNWKWKG